MSSTTLGRIAEKLRTTIEALVPATLADITFNRAPMSEQLREWARTAGSAAARRFAIERSAPREDGTVQGSVTLVTRPVTVLVAYPTDLAMYGERQALDLEDVAEADADQIRAALFDPANLESGAHQANYITVNQLDKTFGPIWYAVLVVRVVYFTAGP